MNKLYYHNIYTTSIILNNYTKYGQVHVHI